MYKATFYRTSAETIKSTCIRRRRIGRSWRTREIKNLLKGIQREGKKIWEGEIKVTVSKYFSISVECPTLDLRKDQFLFDLYRFSISRRFRDSRHSTIIPPRSFLIKYSWANCFERIKKSNAAVENYTKFIPEKVKNDWLKLEFCLRIDTECLKFSDRIFRSVRTFLKIWGKNDFDDRSKCIWIFRQFFFLL